MLAGYRRSPGRRQAPPRDPPDRGSPATRRRPAEGTTGQTLVDSPPSRPPHRGPARPEPQVGAAAGIAAAFNTPIASVLFAVEVLLADISITAFIPVLVAAAAGALMSKILLNENNLEIVKLGMMDVTLPGGTAASVGANAGYAIAAKTGTAQVIGIKQNQKYNEKLINERHRDHALFVAYAPADNPRNCIGCDCRKWWSWWIGCGANSPQSDGLLFAGQTACRRT